MFLLASSETNKFFANQDVSPLPQIEILEPAELPQKKQWAVEPQLLSNPATAVLAADIKSGKIIFQKKIDRAQPIASLTKIMTTYIILENHDLDEVVTVPLSATEVGGAMIGLYEYEKLTVRTLLEASLIPSANDAAVALAVHDAGSEAEFVVKMNQKAKELGLKSAKFYNSTGLDVFDSETNESYGNKMSARDIAKLARMSLANPFFRETVKKSHFYGTSIDEKFFHEKETTNQLLGTFLNLKGVKTGFTYLAGQCFVSLGEDSQGHDILTVVLGSRDRFGETKTLLSWIYDSFVWK